MRSTRTCQQEVQAVTLGVLALALNWLQPMYHSKRACVGFFFSVGVPVSKFTFNWETEPVPFLAAASIGSCFIVTVTLLRLYLGWSFVGNRLLSATVEYEGAQALHLAAF